MAAPWAAGARSRGRDRRWRLRDTDLITGGVSKLESGPEGQNLEDFHLPSSLLTVADSDLGEISGSFPGCIDQSIISIIEATAQTENKLLLDEESEASLLTALTEILDTVDDENPSPFDCIPDSELFAPPKGDQECLLVGHQSCATFPDLGKEPFGHVVPTAPRDLNAQWRSEKLISRSFGEETSKQRSDGEEEEEEDLISNGQGVSELGPGDSLDLQLGEQLDPVGLENNVTLVLESSSPCAHDVPMSDLVKDVRLHCLPNRVMCLGTDIELADSMIELEVHVLQDNEVQDLELPIVLCASSEHLLQMIGENDKESVLAKDPGPESLPQTLKQQEVSPPTPVHLETSPVTVPSGRLRKTSVSDEILIAMQLDRAETSCEHHSLETQVQAAEDQERSIKVQQKQESQFLTQQTEQDVRRIKTRDVTAGRDSSQVTAFSKGAKEPHNPSPCESEPALGDCSIPQSVEPQPGHGVTLVNEAIHPEQTVDNEPVPVPQFPNSDLISQHPGSPSSTISPLSTCDVQSPAVLETTTNESKLRSISLQQYRLRLQQRKRDSVPSVPEKPKVGTDTNSKSAWPVVPIQSIVQGELSILPLEPAGHRTTVETMLVTSPSVPLSEPPPVQQLQSSTATQAYEGVDQGTLSSSVVSNKVKVNLKGIEAADVMSLLEQFEVTEVSEESTPGNSSGSEVPEEWKLLDHIFGAELASTAGLTPPATPPHQMWKSLPPPVCFLGKRKLQETAESFEGSPVRTAKLIDPKPMAQNNWTKCSSLQPSVEPPLTAANGFGDHIYCLPRVSTQWSSCNIYPPAVGQPDVACRWNIKRQANITIKPITSLNRHSRSPTRQARAGDKQRGAGPGIERNTSDSQKTLPGVQVSSNMLPTGTGSEKPSRSFSSAVDQRNIGGDTAEGNCCVTVAPAPNGETEGSKPFDSSHCSRRTRTSPCYRHQRYLSSSSSTSCSRSRSRSRSRSHSPTWKRRRYGRRRSRHSRHSSRSDSRSSSRSRSCSRSNSRSDSGSRSRSRSSRRRSVHMSYFTDTYDVFPEEPRCQYSRAHSRRINQRRELAIEERRVVYVGKIRNGMLREELRRRFEVFGEIEDCNIYFRSEGDNYGFVTYRYTCDAFAAIENGQTLRKPDELPFDLCFGGRRQFCKTNYADLDSSHADYSSYSTKSKFDSLDFDTLLKQAKRSLRR
ncbi:hypothetical protein chiPu_0012496 [Chiloscyllium punctatum]|uniref:RRM domain-containing protein n=1 Tax=Chiloscyllium punctatum TaxID=137246 RepID=A0A401SUI3_CHIPU|nr:hypothetical protein [Chiloscyllium punctatum]